MTLNLLRINVLPIAEDNQFFLTAGDEQIPSCIEIPQITCVQPAILQHRRGRFGPVPVTFHHDRAGDRNLTDGRSSVFLRSWIDHLS